jgi:hypothetical protein
MNNFYQLIRESWQVARRNKLLWLFSFIPVLNNLLLRIGNQEIISRNKPDLILVCSGLIITFFSLFAFTFNTYALPYCATMAIQAKTYEPIDVWNGFKTNVFKFILLGLLSVIYIFSLMFLNFLLWRLLTHAIVNINTMWWYINLQIIFILFGVPIFLSSYGLLFQRMGVFQSFINGFKVFSSNRIPFTIVYAIQYIAYFAIASVVVANLVFNGQAINFENYNNIQKSSIYFPVAISFFYFLLTPITTSAFALSYFKLSPMKI